MHAMGQRLVTEEKDYIKYPKAGADSGLVQAIVRNARFWV